LHDCANKNDYLQFGHAAQGVEMHVRTILSPRRNMSTESYKEKGLQRNVWLSAALFFMEGAMKDHDAERIRNQVMRCLRRWTSDAHLADEVCQNVVLKCLRVERSRGVLPPEFHLPRMTYRFLLEARRAASRFRNRQLVRARMKSELDRESDPKMECERQPPLCRVEEVLSCLSDAERQIIRRRYLQKESYSQIARAMGLGEQAAKSRVCRAITKAGTTARLETNRGF
jgi:RNA polymerase sigma factor (sigma-70 family)